MLRVLPDEWLELLLEEMTIRLEAEITAGLVTDAQSADERAAALVGETELPLESDDYDQVLAALWHVAGTRFPGNWEDY